ncbi:unnamed protein product [Coffea canephora]|uniref:Uncharacterized protein n=1 Tax=Coffea canephora TaxID=49390 RepID=A0A068UFC1_COFCA|nr:unnamed protein product [Coffea canephora]
MPYFAESLSFDHSFFFFQFFLFFSFLFLSFTGFVILLNSICETACIYLYEEIEGCCMISISVCSTGISCV